MAAAIRTLEAAKQYLTDEELDAHLAALEEARRRDGEGGERDPLRHGAVLTEVLSRGRTACSSASIWSADASAADRPRR